jgi:hypothetical protein
MKNPNSFNIQISTNGQISAIYFDDLVGLCEQGKTEIKRASHVEPVEGGHGWMVDMDPVGGPMIGPYRTRGEALTAEINYLDELLFDIGVEE